MDLTNNADLTIVGLAPLLRRRKLSPVELTEFFLARIRRLQPVLNAFITVTAVEARQQARRAEKEICCGQYRGPLHGIPICLKDLFCTRGTRTTAGSKILRRHIPKRNAIVVDRLLEAGAILLGKTNLHEFAYGVTNINPHYGAVLNPWDLCRISGGSSGGSAAAVTAGLAVASLGSDTGGSIRIPAAACGCVGLKPTYGSVSMDGVFPLAPTFDHVGPICRCVEDVATIMGMITGANLSSELSDGLEKLRIGIPRHYFFDRIQKDVRSRVITGIETLEKMGVRLQELSLGRMDETSDIAAEITAAEALAFHWKWFQKRSCDYGEDLRARFEENKDRPALAYLLAQQRRNIYTSELTRELQGVDALAMPTIPIVAPGLGENQVQYSRFHESVRSALLRLTRPGNITGLPAISVPCGFSGEGMPVGLQLMGRKHDESTLLRIAHAFEQSTPWHQAFPEIESNTKKDIE